MRQAVHEQLNDESFFLFSEQWFDGADLIGQGLAFTWEDVSSGFHTVTLTVTDSSGLSESSSQQVNMP